jgi:hypothetical protein
MPTQLCLGKKTSGPNEGEPCMNKFYHTLENKGYCGKHINQAPATNAASVSTGPETELQRDAEEARQGVGQGVGQGEAMDQDEVTSGATSDASHARTWHNAGQPSGSNQAHATENAHGTASGEISDARVLTGLNSSIQAMKLMKNKYANVKAAYQATASAKVVAEARASKATNHILTTPEGNASMDNFVEYFLEFDGPSPINVDILALFNRMVVDPALAKF